MHHGLRADFRNGRIKIGFQIKQKKAGLRNKPGFFNYLNSLEILNCISLKDQPITWSGIPTGISFQ